MIGPGLKKFAKQHNMKIAHGIAYGNFQGYAVTLCEGAGWKRIIVNTRFVDPDKRDAFRVAMAQENLTARYRVKNIEVLENVIGIWFLDQPGTMKKIEEFCQWFFPRLAEYDATGIDICSECGAPIGEDGCWQLMFENAWHMHKSCAENVQMQMDAEAAERLQADTGSYATGVIGALIGAVLGAVVWGVVLHMGFVASIVGFLIGFLAEKGYTLLKGKQSKAKVFIIAGATIFGVLLGNLGYDAVMWAGQNNIVNGTGTNEWGEYYFSPDRSITRQELATMFVRYANRKYIVTETDATLDKYTDKAEVDSWAADALKWATDIELIKGTGSGDTLSPKGKATREQFATIMYRFCEQSEFEYKHNLSEPEPLSTYTEQPYPLVDDADVYVAVDGNDKNPGTKEKPLATFDGARLKVRELKKTAKDEIVVAFMAGEYGSLNNVTFTA